MFFISIATVRLSDTELLDIFYQATEVLNLRERALNKQPITDMEIYTVLILSLWDYVNVNVSN